VCFGVDVANLSVRRCTKRCVLPWPASGWRLAVQGAAFCDWVTDRNLTFKFESCKLMCVVMPCGSVRTKEKKKPKGGLGEPPIHSPCRSLKTQKNKENQLKLLPCHILREFSCHRACERGGEDSIIPQCSKIGFSYPPNPCSSIKPQSSVLPNVCLKNNLQGLDLF